jgi:plasmid stabilization system protein ParE
MKFGLVYFGFENADAHTDEIEKAVKNISDHPHIGKDRANMCFGIVKLRGALRSCGFSMEPWTRSANFNQLLLPPCM